MGRLEEVGEGHVRLDGKNTAVDDITERTMEVREERSVEMLILKVRHSFFL